MSILSENAKLIASKRYYRNKNEGWDGLSVRCGSEASRAESTNQSKWSDKFSEVICNLEFMPGGRILRNLGRLRGSLFNCYVIPINDSIEEIGQFLKEALIIWSEGGGIGTNISSLRPTGTPIKGKGGESSGPISFLKAADAAAATIQSGGQRRAAGMCLEHVRHPGIMEFIDSKSVDEILSYFNISVAVDEEFINAVEKKEKWDLKFNQKIYNTVEASDVWDRIMHNMINYAEPGLLNWNNIRSNNSFYFAPIIGTNPCGEAALEEYGICDLGSIVLTKFISKVNTNWKRMEEVLRVAVRFLDNIIDINKYILQEFALSATNGRRVGVGVMGLAEYLFAKKIRYGSQKSIYEIEKLFKFIRDVTYDESIKLAVEKGAFPKFDPIEYGKAHFIRSLPASTRMDIKKHGIRNVTLTAIAPTGTISMIPEVSSGIEPLPAKAYKRSDRISERYYIHPQFKQFVEDGIDHEEMPEWFVDSFDLDPKNHLDVQVAVQKYVDGAVSKTINMPKGTKTEDLSDLLLEYIHDVKGVTVYVDGSRENQPINKIDVEEAVKSILNGDYNTDIDKEANACPKGNCEI